MNLSCTLLINLCLLQLILIDQALNIDTPDVYWFSNHELQPKQELNLFSKGNYVGPLGLKQTRWEVNSPFQKL